MDRLREGDATFEFTRSDFAMPFYFASLTTCWIFFSVDAANIAEELGAHGLAPAVFDGSASASLNCHVHAGAEGAAIVSIEMAVLALPAGTQQPKTDLRAFLLGQADAARKVGNYRLHVASSDARAVAAGRQLYGEPKFLAECPTRLPSRNTPGLTTWTFGVEHDDGSIFSVSSDLGDLRPMLGDRSTVVQYGVVNGELTASNWTIFGAHDTYFLNESSAHRTTLTLGESAHPMSRTIAALIDGQTVRAVQTFISAPVALQGDVYPVDRVSGSAPQVRATTQSGAQA
jgi:hypothetical protein